MNNKVIQRFENIQCITEHPLAESSPDHLHPLGTRFDRSSNFRFNYKLFQLFRFNKIPQLRLLDLGCSAGTFVKSLIDSGQFAIGIEGSDYSKTYSRDAWSTIPRFLFTADITLPFELLLTVDNNNSKLDFHVITAWEVLEHLTQEQVKGMVQNVSTHLATSGLLIVSIDTTNSFADGDVELHQSILTIDAWEKVFLNLGFTRLTKLEQYFSGQYVRGPKKDHVPSSFNFVLKRTNDPELAKPPVSMKDKCYDNWYYSRPDL